jgi:hypothetical protein
MRDLRILALTLLMVGFAGGCGEDPVTPATTGSVAGTILQLETGLPVTDARVHLVDPWTLAPASPLIGTDRNGHYLFRKVPPGDYSVCVYHDTLFLFERSAPLVHVTEGQRAIHNVRLMDSELWSAGGYRVAGTVVDIETREPLAGAYVEGALWAFQDVGYRFVGLGFAEFAVTDGSGRFSVKVMVFTDEQGNEAGLEPICVSLRGYEPATLGGDGPRDYHLPPALSLPSGDDSTLTVLVALRPLNAGGIGPYGAGAIRGRVAFLGAPVPEIRVAVSLLSSAHPDTFHTAPLGLAVPIPDRVAVTDAEGHFYLDRLSPGSYGVHPGYLDGDGYLAFDNPLVYVDDGETTDVRVLEVQKAIQPLFPRDRSVVEDPTPEFVWEARPDTVGYAFRGYRLQYATSHIDWRVVDGLTDAQWQMPDGEAFGPGAHVRWIVEVRGIPDSLSRERVVARFEHPATFSVAD